MTPIQKKATRLAAALTELEEAIGAIPKCKATTKAATKAARLHRLLHEGVLEYGPAMGIDPMPLSGGTGK